MRIVVIGNGIAGNTAAASARKFDQESHITVVSEEDEPLYSPCALPDYLSGRIGREKVFLKSLRDYSAEGIEILFGTKATALDTQGRVVLLESGTLPYDKLVIATGSKPVLPAIDGLGKEGVFALKSVKDVDRILSYKGNRAAVIGAGPIGVEASVALRKAGYRVFLIELCDWILPRLFDRRPALFLASYLAQRGVEVFTGEKVLAINGDGRVTGISTEKRDLECDLVLLALGMRPDVQLAREAGLVLGALGGVKVDKAMGTSVADVFACGDCAETRDMISGKRALNMLWPSAQQQGEIAGHNCLGHNRLYPGSIAMLGLNIFRLHAVSFGLTAAGISSKHHVEVVEDRFHNGYYRLIVANGFLVGLQAVGMTRGVGHFLGAMGRRVKLGQLRQELNSALLACQPLWRYKVGLKLGRGGTP